MCLCVVTLDSVGSDAITPQETGSPTSFHLPSVLSLIPNTTLLDSVDCISTYSSLFTQDIYGVTAVNTSVGSSIGGLKLKGDGGTLNVSGLTEPIVIRIEHASKEAMLNASRLTNPNITHINGMLLAVPAWLTD